MRFVIYGQPISKKNSQQILMNPKTKRPFIMPSASYRKYEKSACADIRGEMSKYGCEFPISGRCEVRCTFFMGTKRKCDLTNMLEAADDILVKAGVLADDNYGIIESHDGSRVVYDKENPRTEIEIYLIV